MVSERPPEPTTAAGRARAIAFIRRGWGMNNTTEDEAEQVLDIITELLAIEAEAATTAARPGVVVEYVCPTCNGVGAVPKALAAALEARPVPDACDHRFGWCCDFDFDNGTYRSTFECIPRTENAVVVERQAARRFLEAPETRERVLDVARHAFVSREMAVELADAVLAALAPDAE